MDQRLEKGRRIYLARPGRWKDLRISLHASAQARRNIPAKARLTMRRHGYRRIFQNRFLRRRFARFPLEIGSLLHEDIAQRDQARQLLAIDDGQMAKSEL